jgi:proteasome beta subunit
MLPDGTRLSETSSFADYLSVRAPELLPSARVNEGGSLVGVTHGTTIVAATFDGGVVMAGDRRATMGNVIAQRDIQKVFPTDEYSCVGIAGTAGLAVGKSLPVQGERAH